MNPIDHHIVEDARQKALVLVSACAALLVDLQDATPATIEPAVQKVRDAMADLSQPFLDLAQLLAQPARDEATTLLVDAWIAERGEPIPWAKAVEIVAIVDKLPPEERQRLLDL